MNKLKGKVTILFITHQVHKGLQVDEAVILGKEQNNSENQPLTAVQTNLQTSSETVQDY